MPSSERSEDVPSLSIGLQSSRTSESKEWEDTVMDLMRAVVASRDATVAPLNVNVVFQVSGKYTEQDFQGVRTGSFSRARNLLMVQVAVPASMVADGSKDPVTTVRELLLLAIAEAETWARRKRLADGLESLRLLAESV